MTDATSIQSTVVGTASPSRGYSLAHDGSQYIAKPEADYDLVRHFGAACNGSTDDTAAMKLAVSTLVRGNRLRIPGILVTTDTIVCTASGIILEFAAGAAAGSVPNWIANVPDLKGTGGTVGTVVPQVFDSNSSGGLQDTQYVVSYSMTTTVQLDSSWEGRHIWLWDATNAANEGEYIIRRVTSSTGSGSSWSTSLLLIAIRFTPISSDTTAWRIERGALEIRGREVQVRNLTLMPKANIEMHHLLKSTEDETTPLAPPITANDFEHCAFGTDFQGHARHNGFTYDGVASASTGS